MKKSHFLPALLLMPALASAQTQFTVKGKVGQHNTPAKVFLRYPQDGKLVSDSADLVNGTFQFTGTVAEPVNATLLLRHTPADSRAAMNAESVKLYLESGVVNVESADSMKFAKVKGGPVNADSKALQTALEPNEQKFKALDAEYYAKPEAERKDKDFIASLQEKGKGYFEERKAILKKFFETNNKSVVALNALKEYAGGAPEYGDIQPLFAKLAPAVRDGKSGKAYAEQLERIKAVSIGAVAPAFTQNDPEGKPVSLASFRGKYVLIDFWASWCGPCRAENPHVVKAYNEYKDKNFTILGVSLDQPDAKDKWLKAIADDNLTWTQVSDLAFWDNAAAKLYAVRSIPQNFLIDPNGVIIGKNLRGEGLTKKLQEVIK
ncbi:AhpC/TSA family protein [Chitinophaga lutea]|uniref:AhpC/TSA family protein n=1 Tax=Chitinophaga lutea TaxID=2488634 RepID=A0A3N4Q8S1_9BACT|nr:TlpA disulfide reductase family protein [Chitinophaga lutea]RPE12400.1 AhpC/TSA family protein [Chitinophaga lutea]